MRIPDGDVEKMVAGFRSAMAARADPAELFGRAINAAFAARAKREPRRLPESPPRQAPRQQGQFPDGTPVPAEVKRAAIERYETLKEAYYRGDVAGEDLPRMLVSNSAGDGRSPYVRWLLGT